MKWIKENDNDTGANDEYFVEWWNVTNGEKSFRCNTEDDADFLISALTSPSPTNKEVGEDVKNISQSGEQC